MPILNANTGDTLYNSRQTEHAWIEVGKEPRAYTQVYTHNAETELDVRLELDVGSRGQVLYLDKVEFIRHSPSTQRRRK